MACSAHLFSPLHCPSMHSPSSSRFISARPSSATAFGRPPLIVTFLSCSSMLFPALWIYFGQLSLASSSLRLICIAVLLQASSSSIIHLGNRIPHQIAMLAVALECVWLCSRWIKRFQGNPIVEFTWEY